MGVPFRRIAAQLLAMSVAGLLVFPAGAAQALPPSGAAPEGRPVMAEVLRQRMIDQLRSLDVPQGLIDVLQQADPSVDTARFVFGLPATDLDADGVRDVLEWDVTLAITFGTGPQDAVPTIETEGETTITIRRGDDGEKIWKKHYDDFVVPWTARVGKDGRPGVIAIGGILSFITNDPYLNFQALDGRNGKALWFKEYRSVVSSELLQTMAVDAPISAALLDGAKGKADDLVIGRSTLVYGITGYTAATRSVLLDGRDGSDVIHPSVDIGVNWLPFPLPVSDQDGDGLDDYAVTNSIGIDRGGGQDTPTVGGTIYVRRGTDGGEVWTTSGLTFTDFAYAYSLPSVTGGRAKEVAVLTPNDPDREHIKTYLFEGEYGLLRWEKQGYAAAPGDVDDDGVIEVLIDDLFVDEENREVRYTQKMIEPSGKKIWDRTFRWTYEGTPCPLELCFTGLFLSAYVTGDVDVDSVGETIGFFGSQQNAAFTDRLSFLLDGRTGDTIFRKKAVIQAASTAVDGRGMDLSTLKLKKTTFSLTILDGLDQSTLWKSDFSLPDKLLPRRASLFADGFDLADDRCGEQVLNLHDSDANVTYYAVIDGASGRAVWDHWSGPQADSPAFNSARDLNTAC